QAVLDLGRRRPHGKLRARPYLAEEGTLVIHQLDGVVVQQLADRLRQFFRYRCVGPFDGVLGVGREDWRRDCKRENCKLQNAKCKMQIARKAERSATSN